MQDHTLADYLRQRFRLDPQEEERVASLEHVVTRALGIDPSQDVEVDLVMLVPKPGEMFLLCSDGLTLHVPDSEIAEILGEAATLQSACQRLVARALKQGGHDNITAVVVKFIGGDPAPDSSVSDEETEEATMVDSLPVFSDEEADYD